MAASRIKIVENIFSANDQLASENRRLLDEMGVFSINLMASPGAGKTSLILQTIRMLSDKISIGVVEGDTAPVTIDADKITEAGVPAVQINTGGSCHLDASMLRRGLEGLSLTDLDLLIVENVGNLVCPAEFMLGTHSNIVIASIPEGDDKPYKYPNIYRGIDVLILNKVDLLTYIDFHMEYFSQGIALQNPHAIILSLSCKTGEGMQAWCDWLLSRIEQDKK